MKSNIKRLSLCLSALMLLILASPLTVLAAEEEVAASAKFYGTFWSLVPPLVAIALALITKEVYSSLFVGILVGALFYSNFNFEGTILHIFEGGMISVLTDSYNMGILIFLVILGTMVCLMNRAGGSAAFGRWAGKRIKSRVRSGTAGYGHHVLSQSPRHRLLSHLQAGPCAACRNGHEDLPHFYLLGPAVSQWRRCSAEPRRHPLL